MDPDLYIIERLRPADVEPTAQEMSRQRALLFESMQNEPVRRRKNEPIHRIRRLRAGGLLCIAGLAFSIGGGGVGWALADSSAPPQASSPSMPVTVTACSAPGSDGATITYIVEGKMCEPGRIPATNTLSFSSGSPGILYCTISGTSSSPQDQILVIDSSVCPTGYSQVKSTSSS